jgi:hypothetical protein
LRTKTFSIGDRLGWATTDFFSGPAASRITFPLRPRLSGPCFQVPKCRENGFFVRMPMSAGSLPVKL